MTADRQPERKITGNPIGLERLKESIERLLLTSEVQYTVRFDSDWSGGEFAYSWAAIWSEN